MLNKTDLLEKELATLEKISRYKNNWDGNGSEAPCKKSLRLATSWLPKLHSAQTSISESWVPPHISVSESGEVVMEWWHRDKKITLYFCEDHVEGLKVWGVNEDRDMSEFVLENSAKFIPPWTWLIADFDNY